MTEYNEHDKHDRDTINIFKILARIRETLRGILTECESFQNSNVHARDYTDFSPYMKSLWEVHRYLDRLYHYYYHHLDGDILLSSNVDSLVRELKGRQVIVSLDEVSRLEHQLHEFRKHPVSKFLRKCMAYVNGMSLMSYKYENLSSLLTCGDHSTAFKEMIECEVLLIDLSNLFIYLEIYYSFRDAAVTEAVEEMFKKEDRDRVCLDHTVPGSCYHHEYDHFLE